MPFLFGWLLGGAFLNSGLLRPVSTVLFWWGLTCVCFFIGDANISRGAGEALAAVVPAALLAWAMWDPATSRVRFWLVEGIMICAWLVFLGVLIALAVRFALAGFDIRESASDWPLAAVAASGWLVRRALHALIDRSHRRAGARSVVLD